MVMSSPKRSASVPLSPWKPAAAAAVVLLMVSAVVAPAQAPERFMTVRLEVVAADEGTSRPAEAVAALLGQHLAGLGLGAPRDRAPGWLLAVQAEQVFAGDPAPWNDFVLLSYSLLPAVDQFTVVEAMRMQGASLAVRHGESLNHEAQLIASEVSAHLSAWLASLAQ